MRSNSCLRQSEKIKKSKRVPNFVSSPDTHGSPYSRWHGIRIELNGVVYLFEMNVNDHPNSSGDVRLGHVKMADKIKDEWVEMPKEFLDKCRADAELMSMLNERVSVIEFERVQDEDTGDVVQKEPESDEILEE